MRAHEQDHDEDDEGDGGAPFGADELHRQRLREPDDQPASMAPGTLPMPPRMAAANSGRRRSSPICGRIWMISPAMTPATQASAGAERPDRAHDAAHVDADDAGELRVLG